MSVESDDQLAFNTEAQLALEAKWPADVYIPGFALPIRCASPGRVQVGQELGQGGLFPEFDVAFHIRTEFLTNVVLEDGSLATLEDGDTQEATEWTPQLGRTLTCDGVQYRIMRITQPRNHPAVRLGCEAVTKAP